MSGFSGVAFKRFAEPTLGKMLQPAQASPDEVLAPYLKAGHVTWQGLNLPEVLPEMWVKKSSISELHPNVGDLLICEGGEVGRATLVTAPLDSFTIIQNSVHLVRPGVNANTRYLKYALEHVASSGWLDIVCNKATIAHLTVDKLRELQVPFQHLADQERIANFLDDKTARIDALIAEKARLTTLLTESRESVIELAVLPGEGQSLRALKRVTVRIITGPFGSALHSAEYIEGGVPVINPSHIIDADLCPDSRVSVTAEIAESLSSYQLSPGELVVGRRGEMGRCAVVPSEGQGWLCGTGSLLATPNLSEVLPHYLQLVVSSRAARDWLSLESVGSTMENLNAEILGRLPGFFPSIPEQNSRLETARLAMSQHDALISHVHEHIARLREYRSSLISAAVTGLLDLGAPEVGA